MRFQLIRHGVVDSTNERALAAIEAGTARHGDAHVARGQTTGRGRLGRRWESAQDEGLYLSLVLLPEPPGWPAPALTMAAGLAVLDVLSGLHSAGRTPGAGLALPVGELLLEAHLEWPNDVEVGGAKLCGILVESRGFDPKRPHYVIGVGLNLAQRSFEPELLAERRVTSLALLGCALQPLDAAGRVLERLDRRLEQARAAPQSLCDDYLAAANLLEDSVEVSSGARVVHARLEGLSLERGLRLREAAGTKIEIPLEHVSRLVRSSSSS